jgi:hypothetical protein
MDQEDRLAEVTSLRRDLNEGDVDAVGREMPQHERAQAPFVRIGSPALIEYGVETDMEPTRGHPTITIRERVARAQTPSAAGRVRKQRIYHAVADLSLICMASLSLTRNANGRSCSSRLAEELLYVRHRPKELHGLIGKWQEALSFIKAARGVVRSVHYHGKRSNLAASDAPERVSQQISPITSLLKSPVNGKPSQKRRRNERIARKAASGLIREIREFHGRRRECIVTSDGVVRKHEDERRRHVLSCILSSLRSEIPIERVNPATE